MERSLDLSKKKNEWVLYAFIIVLNGGECSMHQLSDHVGKWKKRDSRPIVIGQRIKMNKSKGFSIKEKKFNGGKYNPIVVFNGEIPPIHRRTREDWLNRLSP
jgi:hypothetical protein